MEYKELFKFANANKEKIEFLSNEEFKKFMLENYYNQWKFTQVNFYNATKKSFFEFFNNLDNENLEEFKKVILDFNYFKSEILSILFYITEDFFHDLKNFKQSEFKTVIKNNFSEIDRIKDYFFDEIKYTNYNYFILFFKNNSQLLNSIIIEFLKNKEFQKEILYRIKNGIYNKKIDDDFIIKKVENKIQF